MGQRTPSLAAVAVVSTSALVCGLIASTPASAVDVTPRAVPMTAIQGLLPKSWANGKVMLLAVGGRAYSSKVASSGAWKVTAPKATAVGASLQLVKANNRYGGPVILRVSSNAPKKPRAFYSHLRLNGKSGNVGLLTVLPGAARVTNPKLGTAISAASRVKAQAANGLPYGTIKSGIVRAPGAVKSLEITGRSIPTQRAGGNPATVGAGADPDNDGIPNTFDADDNGNTTLDMTDVNSTNGQNATAVLNPFTTLNLSPSDQINAHLGDVTQGDIANALGGANTFGLAFYFDQPYLFPSGPDANLGNSPTAVKRVWIDCGALPYCGTGGNSAVITGMSENSAFSPSAWDTYLGDRWSNNLATGPLLDSPRNALYALFRNGASQPAWVAGIQPRTGAETLTKFKPGDVYVLNYRVGTETADRSISMMLNPYFVTTPALKNANAVLNGNDLTPTNGNLNLEIFRPQRQTVEGEAGQWRDLANLHYGLVLNNGGSQLGCAPARYSGLSGVAKRNDPSGNMNLWPLHDTSTTDMTLADGAAGIAATVDIAGCAADHSIPSHTQLRASIVATGEQTSGGASQATLSNLTITVP